MELIGAGRDADVYALDGTRVLRRYRHGGSAHEEARLMAHLAGVGFAVPRVHDADGTDLVMDRLTGPTMARDLARRPWRAYAHGRLLAGLQASLHAVPAPRWLGRRFTSGDPARDRVLHLDLHPENVILTPEGPVLIDWSNAAAGDPAADTALTVAILRGVGLGPVRDVGLRVFVAGFLHAAPADPAPRMAEAIAARLANPNLLPAEEQRLRRFARRSPEVN
ncbi:aminoglycoside phosphotransferase family protein [Streptomyces sp. NPDC006207]|nr:aminoglycoside phosphotransferase family protein [Streptomyces sp. PA03-5A]